MSLSVSFIFLLVASIGAVVADSENVLVLTEV